MQDLSLFSSTLPIPSSHPARKYQFDPPSDLLGSCEIVMDPAVVHTVRARWVVSVHLSTVLSCYQVAAPG